MPREYRSTGGPASPSPIGFGAADLNLQNPRFVAQTNVATPENVFASLQQILGVAAQVGGQLMRYKAEDIEGKISYEKALEAKQDREIARQDREAARKAAEYSAGVEERIAKAKSPEEAQAIRTEILKSMDSGDTAEMRSTKARLAQSSESEARQKAQEEKAQVLDNVLSIKAQSDLRIQNAVGANDVNALAALELDFALNATLTDDPRIRSTYNELRESTFARRKTLESKAEFEDNKEQAALTQLAKDRTTEAIQGLVVAEGSRIVEFASSLKGISDDSLNKAVFDHFRNKLLEDPQMEVLMEGASEAELKAVSEAIQTQIAPVLRSVVSIRNQEQVRRAEDVTIQSFARAGESDPIKAFNDLDADFTLSADGKNKAYGAIARSYIESQATPVERLRAAEEVSAIGERPAQVAAARLVTKEMNTVSAEVSLERDQLVENSKQDADPLTVGWTSKYKNKEEFIADILERHLGTTVDGLTTAPLSIKQYASQLSGQWDDDMSRTSVNQRRQEAEIRRADIDERRKLKIGDVWDTSPLAASIKDGSYQQASSADLEPLVQESLIGYADSELPSDLKKVIVDDLDNPRNYALIAAYWNVQNRALDPRARNAALSDPKTGMSWAVGLYVNHLGPEVDPETSAGRTIEFVGNLNVFKESANAETLEKNRRYAFDVISGGIGQDTGLFDFTGPSPKAAMETLPPGDMEVMMHFAAVAACAPNDADRKALYASMMQQSGYRIFPTKDDNGETVFRMIQNIPRFVPTNQGVDRPTTPLPDPAVLETDDWNDYVNSNKPSVVSYLNDTKTLQTNMPPPRGSEYSLADIEDVRYVIYDTNARQGFTAIKAKVGGRWLSVPPSYVRLSAEDYEAKRPQRDAARKAAGQADMQTMANEYGIDRPTTDN
jgi:hypothetical protein